MPGGLGPPVLQPYFDLIKLFQKGSVFSTTTTWVFRAGPVVALATTVIAAMMIPLTDSQAPISFTGDFILFAYLLGLGRFFTCVAALDTGSAFEGMGAAREVTFACLAEPALFLGLLVLAKLSGSLQLSNLLGSSLASHWPVSSASLALVLLSWLIILLAENSRIPFDDPNTHLELTMIHEVMVLDHSGPALGMILYGAALKLLVFTMLVVRVALPHDYRPCLARLADLHCRGTSRRCADWCCGIEYGSSPADARAAVVGGVLLAVGVWHRLTREVTQCPNCSIPC